MRRLLLAGAVLMTALACACSGGSSGGGAGSASGTAQVCADFKTVLHRYTVDGPEVKSFNAAVEDRYHGRDEPGVYASAYTAWVGAYQRDLRALADRASDPALRTALTDLADSVRTAAPTSGDSEAIAHALEAVSRICPLAESVGP